MGPPFRLRIPQEGTVLGVRPSFSGRIGKRTARRLRPPRSKDWEAMEYRSYSISPDVFARFPGYVRGVVIAHDVPTEPHRPRSCSCCARPRSRCAPGCRIEQIAEEPRIKAWRDAYRAFGAKPAEFRSSVEAMARRALRGDELPAINALVDIGNVDLAAPSHPRRRPRHRRAEGRHRAAVRRRPTKSSSPSGPTSWSTRCRAR